MQTYQVWGIRRSGNHAIIGWMLQHTGAPFVHFNDIQDPLNPFTPGGVSVMGVPAWRYKRGLLRKIRHYFTSRNKVMFAGSDSTVDYEGLAGIRGLRCRVFSYEDKLIADSDGALASAASGESRRSIVLLRDPFNLFASLLKAGCFSRRLDEFPGIYARHAEAFLRGRETGLIGVNYNEWFQHAHYRISIARRLGFDTDGAPYDDIPSNGGGSSFSGRAYRGKASQMDVSGRWKRALLHPHFQRLVEAPEVRDAAEAIFPLLAREVYQALSDVRSTAETQAFGRRGGVTSPGGTFSTSHPDVSAPMSRARGALRRREH